MKKNIRVLAIAFLLTTAFIFLKSYLIFPKYLNLKIYDVLCRLEYRLSKPPAEAKDIVIVGIDNETVSKMPYRWPYPRSIFANAINNLSAAGARVIAFDFVFLGKSDDKNDESLEQALTQNKNIILASTIDESGSLNIRSMSRLSARVPSGIVTKMQDDDGAIRRNLTYLISDEVPPKGFLSWELTILKLSEGLELAPIKGDECFISITNNKLEKWLIPVDCQNKSFLINFRAHTGDFTRMPFYSAYKGEFDPSIVKDKIVLIGFLSSLLGDIHNTPIGWMPGVTLNANSLLTLVTHSFIHELPEKISNIVIFAGVLLSTMVALILKPRATYFFIAGEIILFLVLSYVLLTMGYAWEYFTFPFCVLIAPFLGKKIHSFIWQRKKFYWT